MSWSWWSADDWVRHYAPQPAYAAGFTLPPAVIAYRNMWAPYIRQVVQAANACADAYGTAADSRSLGGPQYAGPSMKIISSLHRVNANALQTEWNNTGDYHLVTSPATALKQSQDVVVTRTKQVLDNVRRDCPNVPMPTAVPSTGVQAQVIGTLEHLGIIASGALQTVTSTGEGLLVKAEEEAMRGPRMLLDAAHAELERERKAFEKTLKYLAIGGVAVVGAMMLMNQRGGAQSSS